MKGWADHCSSDEEDVVAEPFNRNVQADDETAEQVEEERGEEVAPAPPRKKEYKFPSEPPFTAYVGNLSYDLKDSVVLANLLTELVKEKTGEDIEISEPRIMIDHRSGSEKHRGFAYVHVATLDQLKILMTLNDSESLIGGRSVKLDTAPQRKNNRSGGRRGGKPDFDGSSFRGGAFSKSSSSGERPSLKLQPRSKPVEAAIQGGATRGGIFGGGKANDAGSWRSRKAEDNQSHAKNGGKRGDKRGGKKEKKKAPVAAAPPVPAPAAEAVKKPETKAINVFAALSMGDSDSD